MRIETARRKERMISQSPNSQSVPGSVDVSYEGPRGLKRLFNGYFIIGSAATALALTTAAECFSVFHLPSLLYGAALWWWWGIVGCALWWTGQRTAAGLSFSAKALAIHIPLAAFLGWIHLIALWSLGFTGLGWYADLSPQGAWGSLVNVNRYGIELLTYGFVFGIIGVVQYQIRAQREALKAVELQRQLSAAQLRALQMQLEPHFLFNTLNAITTLVELGRQDQAVEMLEHLNAILKSTLRRTGPEKIPLSQELEMVENYLAIEQVRFADRLRIEIKVEPSALDSLVPCFLLQPIVENAIRHGIAHCEGDGLVQATAQRDGDFLRLEVRDSGSGKQSRTFPGNGIGLKNTRERLAHFYEDSYEMKANLMDTGGFKVAITIPYERSRCD
jgi:signal transduction histidine kinase